VREQRVALNAPIGVVCVKCAAVDAPRERNVRFVYVPPWVYLTLLLGLLPCLIVALLTQKTSRHVVRLCTRCSRRWVLGAWLGFAGVLLVVVMVILAAVALALERWALGGVAVSLLAVASSASSAQPICASRTASSIVRASP
jgi:hypothetical protein